MTIFSKEDFLHRLETYGSDFSRWPETEQAAAEAFLEVADDDLRAVYFEEAAFDVLIAPLGVDPEVPVSLEEALLAGAPAPSSFGGRKSGGGLIEWLSAFRAPKWASAAFAALCLVGGTGAGYGVSLVENSAYEADTLMAMAVVSTPNLIEEWTADMEVEQ